jgi:thiamine-phosphate pyrophosphorylase
MELGGTLELSGAIFDMDGTLLDSMSCWNTLASSYLRTRRIEPEHGLDYKINAMSLPQNAQYLHENYLPDTSVEQIMEDINASVEQFYRDTADFKPGARAFLDKLAAHDIPMCVISATDLVHVETALRRLGARHYFKELYTCTEFGSHKDEPEIFEAALACLGTPRESTVVFEDALYALQTAKAAGYPAVAILDPSSAADWNKMETLADKTIESWVSLNGRRGLIEGKCPRSGVRR